MIRTNGLTPGQATAIGLLAPVCWGLTVSLVRGIAEGFGMAQGEFLLYLIATVSVFLAAGLPDFSRMDRRYLFLGVPTACVSSLSFCLAIFTSDGGAQTMEVGMVNYTWPALTVLFAVLFNGVKARWWLYAGLVVAFAGIVKVLSGDAGFSFAGFAARFAQNPVSYMLAVLASVSWAGFSSMTRAWSRGQNPSAVIFCIDMILFGLLWAAGIGTEPTGVTECVTLYGIVSVILGGMTLGAAYLVWTIGMSRGNITVLAVASYFTPVLSCIFAVFWINADLQGDFWTGVALVVAGSLVCWDATGRGMKALEKKQCVK